MPDYKQMYLKLMRACDKATELLITAQQECEEIYISSPQPELKIIPHDSDGSGKNGK